MNEIFPEPKRLEFESAQPGKGALAWIQTKLSISLEPDLEQYTILGESTNLVRSHIIEINSVIQILSFILTDTKSSKSVQWSLVVKRSP